MADEQPTCRTLRWLEDDRERAIAEYPDFDPNVVAQVEVAKPADVHRVLCANVGDMDGRSEWLWIRLPEGTLIMGCFPAGDTYFDTEEGRNV